MLPLALLSTGEKAEVLETNWQGLLSPGAACQRNKPECCSRLEDMGLRVGKTVEILNNNRGPGVLLVKVDGSRIAMNRGMAMKIMVRRQIG